MFSTVRFRGPARAEDFGMVIKRMSDEELAAMLRSRFADLRSGKDRGLSFEEVFGEKA